MGLKPDALTSNNRIGIDLSTKVIGIAMFVDGENKQVALFETKLQETPNWDKTLYDELKQMVDKCNFQKNFEVYIEVGNFGSPLMTQKFAYIAGMIAAICYELGSEIVCLVRPHDWFTALSKRNASKPIFLKAGTIPRSEKKKIVVEELIEDIAKNVEYDGDITKITNDMADAYFIARYGNVCMHAFWDKKHKEMFKQRIKIRRRNSE